MFTSMSMRLLFLADAVFDDLAGGSRVVARELARKHVSNGHEVTFLVGRQIPNTPDDERTKEGIRIVRYNGAGSAIDFVRNGRAASARLWSENPFDIIHTHFAYAAIGPLQAIPKRTPHVRTFHGPWDEESWLEETAQPLPWFKMLLASIKKKMRHQVEVSNLNRSAAVLTLSDYFRNTVINSYGVRDKFVRVIPGGTDVARFMPTSNKMLLRGELGLPQERKIILSVRRLAPRMGLDNLIKAMPAVIEKHPDALLLIGGKGREREHLDSLIVDLHLSDHARMIGFISDDQLARFYQAADVFVLPTLALEGFGLVTTEALASGLPVIGTPVGATPEILASLESRLVAAGTTPSDLSSALISFLGGSWAGELTPQRLHKYVTDRYTWDRYAQKVEEIYSAVAANRPLPAQS